MEWKRPWRVAYVSVHTCSSRVCTRTQYWWDTHPSRNKSHWRRVSRSPSIAGSPTRTRSAFPSERTNERAHIPRFCADSQLSDFTPLQLSYYHWYYSECCQSELWDSILYHNYEHEGRAVRRCAGMPLFNRNGNALKYHCARRVRPAVATPPPVLNAG